MTIVSFLQGATCPNHLERLQVKEEKMKSFSWLVQRPSILWPVLCLNGVLILFVTGCGREGVAVYNTPKEQTAPAAANPHGDMHAGHGLPAAGAPKIEYTAPAGWEQLPGGGMRAAHFGVTGQNGNKADVSVVPLPGATAPDSDIINMWRQQIGLKLVETNETAAQGQKVDIGPVQGQFFDLVSAEPLIDNKYKAGILAALLRHEQAIWVFKMTGEAELVQQQKPAFLSFLKSVRFVEGAASSAGTAMDSADATQTAHAAHAGESASKPTWTVPPSWKQQPPTQMVIAKFAVTGTENNQTEITVSSFPGDVGGLLANVNRWRGQIGLEPIAEADLPKNISSFDTQAGKATLVEISGTNPRTGQKARLIGAIVGRGEQTWFYKMIGDEQLTAREKDAFIKFVQSVRYPNA